MVVCLIAERDSERVKPVFPFHPPSFQQHKSAHLKED